MKMRMKKETETETVHDDDDIESVNSDEFNMLLSKHLYTSFCFRNVLGLWA